MGNVYSPGLSPKPLPMRTLIRKRGNAVAAIVTCENALERFPEDAVYTRSLNHWKRIEADLSAEITRRMG